MAIVRAARYWPNMREFYGDDPEAWLSEGVEIYRTALEATLADVSETRRTK